MLSLFLNERGEIRSGWRVAVFILAFTFAAVLLGTLGQVTMSAIGIGQSSGTYLIINAILSLIPAILIGWVCGRIFEHLPYRALGAAFAENWLKNWVAGAVMGSATLGFAVIVAYTFGRLRFEISAANTSAIFSSLAISFAVFAAASAFEEALFRGYILQTFSRAGYAWLAILLTSVFFGAVHFGNPNASIFSTLNTILAGVWFSIAYLKTRDLWFVWGLHLMWNWVQGSIFGIEVSGLTNITTTPLLREIDSGPTWLTGQTYGIEGGVACTIAITVSIVAVHFLPVLKPDEELLAMTSASR